MEEISLLGKGSYGAVYKVKDGLAAKLYNSKDYSSQILEVFILSRLNHKNILRIYSASFTKHYITMPCYDCNLFDFIKDKRPLTANMVCDFAYQLLDALVYLNKKNIIHCDIKPNNILVKFGAKQDETPRLVLCDFGISAVHREIINYRAVQAEPYRAPEVWNRPSTFNYSQKIDIWSLGCVLFELITGERFVVVNEDIGLICSLARAFGYQYLSTNSKTLKMLRSLESKDIEFALERRMVGRMRCGAQNTKWACRLIAPMLTPALSKRTTARIARNQIRKYTSYRVSDTYHTEKRCIEPNDVNIPDVSSAVGSFVNGSSYITRWIWCSLLPADVSGLSDETLMAYLYIASCIARTKIHDMPEANNAEVEKIMASWLS